MGINRVVISGNLTRDAESRYTAGGLCVVGLGVAVNDRRRNPQTGEWEDYPNYIDCAIFGTRAEKLHRYLVKGTKVAIEGRLRWSQWEKDGQKRSKVDVVVEKIEFMTRIGFQQRDASEQAGQQANPLPTAGPAAPSFGSTATAVGIGAMGSAGVSAYGVPAGEGAPAALSTEDQLSAAASPLVAYASSDGSPSGSGNAAQGAPDQAPQQNAPLSYGAPPVADNASSSGDIDGVYEDDIPF